VRRQASTATLASWGEFAIFVSGQLPTDDPADGFGRYVEAMKKIEKTLIKELEVAARA
jgi:hypothetical protein